MTARLLRGLWTNRFSVLLLAALVLGAGLAALRALPETVFPDLAFPKVVVLVSDGQVPVKLMLLTVTRPLELVAQGEPGVRLVRSQTGNGLSKLHVYFTAGTDPETAYLLLQARLAHVRLPPGATMSVRLQTPEVYPFAEYALVSNRIDSSAMQPLFAFQLRPALIGVPGVYKVTGIGRGWPEVRVDLSRRRLAAHDLTAAQVVAALDAAQGPFFSGVLDAFHQQFVLATDPRPATPAALARLMLPLGPAGPGGMRLPLALGALGTVRTGPPPLLHDAAVAGWKHALVVNIQPQAGVNQVALGRAVRARIAALRAHLPAGVHLVPVYDLSRLIAGSLRDVWLALILGSVIAWLVVLVFLRRVGAALATLLVVPLAIAATLLVLRLLGFGLNIMTLGGLTAAIGALVDHAIVVMERGLHATGADPAARRRSAIAEAARILPPMTLGHHHLLPRVRAADRAHRHDRAAVPADGARHRGGADHLATGGADGDPGPGGVAGRAWRTAAAIAVGPAAAALVHAPSGGRDASALAGCGRGPAARRPRRRRGGAAADRLPAALG